MKRLVQEKEKALDLRRKGYTYQEILKEVKVSKSSLSLWLMNMPLTDIEKHALKKRRDDNISRGRIRAAGSHHMRKVIREGFLMKDAKKEFGVMSKDPLFHIGIALYWAEGAKRNPYFAFTNADPDMVNLMLRWAKKFLKIMDEEVALRLYLHTAYMHEDCKGFWSQKTGIPLTNFKKTAIKPTVSLSKKRPGYMGCARLELYKVAYIQRMKHWQKMLVERYRD